MPKLSALPEHLTASVCLKARVMGRLVTTEIPGKHSLFEAIFSYIGAYRRRFTKSCVYRDWKDSELDISDYI